VTGNFRSLQSTLAHQRRIRIARTAELAVGLVTAASWLLALIEAHEDTTDQAVRTAIADSRHGSIGNLVECQKSGIRPHLKLLGDSHRGKGRSAGIPGLYALVHHSAEER
jgi:hypothetical protein